MNRDPFEQDREDNVVNERWAVEEGNTRWDGTIGKWVPCEPEPDPEPICKHCGEVRSAHSEEMPYDGPDCDGFSYVTEPQPYHDALPAFHERPEDELLRYIKAMKQNDEFLIRALRRAGVR